MADAPVELDELVDLKILPAWVNEPAPTERYAQHQGEDRLDRRPRDQRPRDKRRPDRKGPQPSFERPTQKGKMPERPRRHDRRPPRAQDRHRKDRPGFVNRQSGSDRPLPAIAVKFLPRMSAFENVVAQIKSGSVAYSLFALARLFLEKATRHDVQLTAPPESPLFQLGENGAVSVDRQFIERNAFRFAQADFYKIEITETDPIKGNFTNVARCRLSGTFLGPTNHHDYQRRLRNLYEQRFSRRMNFPDYQRQIQIVTDPAEIEKWKEDARKVTTFSTLRDEAPTTFSSVTETERHFQQNYLPGLVRSISDLVIDGPASRRLDDRVLNRLVENEWTHETRSPSSMMKELAARFREVGLHVFRHRRGMLFVSSIYPRAFKHDETGVSSQVRAILEAIGAMPRIGRKELADKLIVDLTADEAERMKMALASDLRWLINEGYVIEFNDGSLDLPRAKVKPKETAEATTPEEKAEEKTIVANVPAAEKEERVEAGAPPVENSSVRQEAAKEIGTEVGAIDPIARGRFGEPPLPEEETEIGGS
ncbi:MAG TPA: hypothetical protein VNW72_13255 [Chthoniobacterales bacterium]|nr:hypothetical protein [Chthoniobacterales bacterium]